MSRSGADLIVQYAVLGKLWARPKIDEKRVKVRKKAHMLRDGRTLCRAENGYKKQPRFLCEIWEIFRPVPCVTVRNIFETNRAIGLSLRGGGEYLCECV